MDEPLCLTPASMAVVHDHSFSTKTGKDVIGLSQTPAINNIPADITIHLTQDIQQCFICDAKTKDSTYTLATCQTRYTKSQVLEKLAELIGEKYMIVISSTDVICSNCAVLVNKLDRLEQEACNVRGTILRFLECRYSLFDGDLVNERCDFNKKPKSCHTTNQVSTITINQIPTITTNPIVPLVPSQIPPLVQVPPLVRNAAPRLVQVPPLPRTQTLNKNKEQNYKRALPNISGASQCEYNKNKSVSTEFNNYKYSTSHNNVYMHRQMHQNNEQVNSCSKNGFSRILPDISDENCSQLKDIKILNTDQKLGEKSNSRAVPYTDMNMEISNSHLVNLTKNQNKNNFKARIPSGVAQGANAENSTPDTNLHISNMQIENENLTSSLYLQVFQPINNTEKAPSTMMTYNDIVTNDITLNVVENPGESSHPMIFISDNNGLVEAAEIHCLDSLLNNANVQLE